MLENYLSEKNEEGDGSGRHWTTAQERLALHLSRKIEEGGPIHLTYAVLNSYGFTQHCQGCFWVKSKIGPNKKHSEACRRRIEGEIANCRNDTRARMAFERL